ncbi:50S ribosomal protein L18 [Candidatus Nomurabacteria bacterium RIFCSPHIGHO2_01_FULL_39_220]|uniref:Large ribosomal subunit protein uL18 n=1 Tax=Candidatus Nomurabacteria bacterium RIFCSPLOWO2_02_FULL_40_67 TaxID=1801787 RepID=A0A1F6Y6S2_9BACT|nr:MAG: 50S ribosomal protein L18 [Parcubacteria group bacterium GW2011_GWA2_40_37]KKS10902.1 MAG: 50S ribosomal protein L18 [Parcubacteria group bacterium GW2011_GWB1_41_5]KKS73362.1 MAG: 50S ribosomal protein L18 [Parcubacteria group bacterium GW2011_GWF2_42_7]OGI62914.1 MAG: 50S ribosomal protein L18 [Candidatus Nomurabacteria bacterium RBG_16_40_11]OGI70488.1 MAG: 50S ribosomal protein L18 [Candidatus Nomurabacteria bacterium RIFCSPHIGHO2_01_FULL_39_220]OGI71889.1 MAG: 50S ribosomal protei
MQNQQDKRIRLKAKIRSKMTGTKERPRLSIFKSNKFIYAQIIDDGRKRTLAQASDVKIDKGTKTERAKGVGKMIAEVALLAKIDKVVFDRNGFKYTGRIKMLADEARAGGLKF